MKNNYTQKQIKEALNYWKNKLRKMDESEEIDESGLAKQQQKPLMDYLKKNKLDPAKLSDKEWTDISKKLFPKQKLGGNQLKAFATSDKAKQLDDADNAENDKKEGAVDAKTEKAIDSAVDDMDAGDIGLQNSEEEAEKKSQAKPIGSMSLMNRLHRLHNATRKHVREKLASFLKFVEAEAVTVDNSCDDNGKFTIPEDGNMYINIGVSISAANRKGFKKFIGGMFGKAMNEQDLDEGVFSSLFGGLWKGTKNAAAAVAQGAKEGTQNAVKAYQENLVKVNETMKKRVGVAAIQEYVMRFCGKELAKKVNYQNISLALENEGTEDAKYIFTGCIKIVD